MQPPLTPNELDALPEKAKRCAVWSCPKDRVPETDFCSSHTSPPAQRTCPDCQRAGRGNGAVFMASGVAVCGVCSWGRSRVPKKAPSRKAAKNKQRRR